MEHDLTQLNKEKYQDGITAIKQKSMNGNKKDIITGMPILTDTRNLALNLVPTSKT